MLDKDDIEVRPGPHTPALYRGKEGYTLVELLIALAVISVLAAIAVPNYIKHVARTQVIADLATLKKAIELQGADTDMWPGGHRPFVCPRNLTPSQNGQEYADLTDPDIGLFNNDNNTFYNWTGPYLSSTLLDVSTGKFIDPWGTPYFIDYDYDVNGKWVVAIGSFGPNKTGMNNYDSDDIYIIVAR